MKFEYPSGATPLDPDETAGLIPSHITTQNDLNEWEAQNILNAEKSLTAKVSLGNFLTIDFTKNLHQKMFGDTWQWAGTFRVTGKNIGVPSSSISPELKNLLDDVIYQLTNLSYPVDEIAYRFHHRLVWIHPFPNGNGRHSRRMTDLLLTQAGEHPFSWGRTTLVQNSVTRDKYIEALRFADKGDYTKLAAFVRS